MIRNSQGLRWDAFICVGWQITLYNPVWQVTLRSCVMVFLQRSSAWRMKRQTDKADFEVEVMRRRQALISRYSWCDRQKMTGGSSCSGGVITAATVEWRRLTSAMTSNGNVCKRQERQTRQETADIEDLQQRPHNHHHHRPVESHRGHRETFLRAPKHFRRALLWKKSEFFFKMVHSGVFYISERRRGPQMSRGPG